MAEIDFIEIQSLIRAGKLNGLEKLYKALYTNLINYSTALCGNRQLALDLMHDAYVKLWDYREKLPDSLHIKSYLYAIVTHLWINHQRHNAVVANHARDFELYRELLNVACDENPDPETRDLLWHAVNSLPERARLIFLMFVIEGKKQADIADSLGISPKTVEVQVYKAKHFLRNKLKNLKTSKGFQ